ncbi:hypothetical protein MJO28_016214 [Puccinia striiformis f. sp. tritici]|uniref:Uncharacterized protein n=1 Tax=Puccinia striiformis f. sp. tritici TaxID=168172 RepID=A0ACC0DMJ5_9BASI|nr:hypothetical protein Pst134EA_030677 [Puccinia striiformis f. sp. tritici]KAH9446771.1 hypothetical protein Pst134EA_030677 [Puccinia striiformis f. sp. tritici]KAI7935343.1 hypothetical protein MJO28_016214 [Puccinia striiformis f. sp. tritici]
MRLLADKHIQYIQSLDQNRDSLAYHLTEHLRINGVYWGLTSTLLLDRPGGLPRQEMIDWVMSCWEPDSGGFRPHPGHDPHIHSTLSAIQILTMQDSLHVIDKPKVMNYILSLFDAERGSFSGDGWGETDARFSYCAVAGLALLGGLDKLDRDAVIGFISRCQNFDGGFGMVEGAESHAAYVWTCVGTLAILDRLDIVDANTLGWWLSERQVPNGGLNGRPEKLEDVCYSWWALASLVIIGKSEWIDRSKLTSFILSCQDPDSGGIADRPDDMPDVWHTVFGLAGLSMLGYEGLKPVDPVFCMPAQFTKGLVKVTS